MQFKFFWEKVDVDVQRKDQQCYWSSFVCMAAIDKAEVPHFQRKYNKLQIATSTGRLISNWFFEIIDLWPLVEADIEYMSQLLLLGKVEYGGGPIFKVVLEC